MLVGGVVLIVLAMVLIAVHVTSRRKAGRLASARRATSGELKEIADKVASELGAGGFCELVELVGEATCEPPLIAPLSGAPCLYYELTVIREYEEDYDSKDSNGNVRRMTRRGTEQMTRECNHTDFILTDESGTVKVRLDGASYDGLRKTGERFDPGGVNHGIMNLSVGGLSFGVRVPTHQRRRTLGFRHREQILPSGTRLTVVASVTDEGGRLAATSRADSPFIVSTRSKSEMIGSANTMAKVTAAGSGICALAGVALVIAGLFQ